MRRKLNIGIIPDGNRRWARKHNASWTTAYELGATIAANLVSGARHEGSVGRIVFYALSQEDFRNRPPAQVEAILAGVRRFFDLVRNFQGVLVKCYGYYWHEKIAPLMSAVPPQKGEHVIEVDLLLNYSAEQEYNDHVGSLPIPPLDMVIKTGGGRNLAGFLPRQSSNADLFFLDVLWQDFNLQSFLGCLERHRVEMSRVPGI